MSKSIIRNVEKALKKAKKLGGKSDLNCIAELDMTAVEQAKKLEQSDKKDLLLYGVPILVKDNIDVKGLCNSAGSLALSDNIPTDDAPVIKNLRKNGAVILGKTNMTEFANYVTQGMPGGYSSRGGQVIHAINPKVNPSGSSSGSAVAVSAGIVPMAVGTDTSFSVIACAQINGICGLKPPIGALPGEGIIPIAKTLDSAGPMAGNFSDTLKLYSAMRDNPFPKVEAAALKGLRIGVNQANYSMVSEGQKKFLDTILNRLKRSGVIIEEIFQEPTPYLKTIMKFEFKEMLEEYLKNATASRKTLTEIVEYYEAHPETMMKYGYLYLKASLVETPGGLLNEEYLEAMRIRQEMMETITNENEAYDAVIMTGPTNIMHFCGLPSVTVAGKVKNEQGVKRALIMYGTDEYRLYAAALAIEKNLYGVRR